MITIIGPAMPPVHGAALMLAQFMAACSAQSLDVRLVASNVPGSPALSGRLDLRYPLYLVRLLCTAVWLSLGRRRHGQVCLICAPKGVAFYRDVMIALIFRILRRRFVVYIQGTELATTRGLTRLLTLAAYARADQLYCSEPLAKLHSFMQKPGKKSLGVPNGVPDHLVGSIDEKVARFDPKRPRLLYLSNIFARKRLGDFLETLHELKARNVDFTAHIAGRLFDGYTTESLQQALIDHGIADRTKYLGALDEAGKRSALSSSDIMLFTPQDEAFGNVIIEAMSAGTLVIANDTTSMRVMIDTDEVGFVLQPYDKAAAADIVQALDRAKFRQVVTAGRARYEAHFTIGHYAGRMIDALAATK